MSIRSVDFRVKWSLPLVILALLIALPVLGDTCSFVLSANGESFTNAGGTGSVNVTTSPFFGYARNAVSNAGWITNISTSHRSVDASCGTVSYTVLPNTGPDRSGTLTITGATYTVTQSGSNTHTGSNVMVQLGAITVNFANVRAAGTTRVAPQPPPIIPQDPIIPPDPDPASGIPGL